MKIKRHRILLFVAVAGVMAAAGVYWGWKYCRTAPTVAPAAVMDTVAPPVKTYRYNLPTEGLDTLRHVLLPGENLSAVLTRHGLESSQIHELQEKAKGVFDVRRLRAGQPYTVYLPKDSTQSARYLVYEDDAVNYVVFDLQPEGKVWTGQKTVNWEHRSVKGKVATSLWQAMETTGTSPQLALTLSHIFGWTIDFFGLQEEDEFRVIYEQATVEETRLDDFRVLAASFRTGDSLYYAIPFTQDSTSMFYGYDGNSLEGTFLKAPLNFYRISSHFTNSRYHPILRRYRPHHGVDYAAPQGTPVYAIGDGKVMTTGYQRGGAGRYLKIRHGGGYVTSYMHLSRFAKGIKAGSTVRQKQVVGYVGSTGLSTGPHLDFRVYEQGRPINPLTLRSEPKCPISEKNSERFKVVRDSLVRQLEAL